MSKINLNFLFGKKIKTIREKLQLSQEGFSELIGIERDSISKIENGKLFPSGKRLEKIALKLNIKYSELFDFDDEDLTGIIDNILYSEIQEIKDEKNKQYILKTIRLYKEYHNK